MNISSFRYGRDYYINHAKHATGKTPNSTIDDDADEWLSIGDTTATVAESVPIESSNKVSASSHQQNALERRNATAYLNDCEHNDDVDISQSHPGFRLARRAYSMRSLRNNLNGSCNSSGNSLGENDRRCSVASDEQRRRRHIYLPHHSRHRRPPSAAVVHTDFGLFDRESAPRSISSALRKNGQQYSKQSHLTTASATAAFEADTLRGNFRRDCLRVSRNGTANFVENPLFMDD